MNISMKTTRAEPFPRDVGWRDVLVIGGGASGVLFAANLLRRDTDLRVTVIEAGRMLGCGLAYSTTDPDHLLNTRVHNMSAFPDDAEHFLRWLRMRPEGALCDADSFVGRATYGRYMSCLLAPWAASDRLLCVKGACVALRERAGGVKATLEDGTVLKGAYAILATGHVEPRPDPSGLVTGAWRPAAPPAPDAPVLIVGTGLSMVDQVLSLERAGHRGHVTAISRRGLLPRPHGPGRAMAFARDEVPLGQPVSALLRWLRAQTRAAEAEGGDWRSAVDGVRPWVSAIWRAMDVDQRARFLRHGASWWEVHRHRIPPASAEKLDRAMAAGRLTVARAAFLRAEPAGQKGAARAILRPRGSHEEQALEVARIIDCRGIRNDPERNASPLIAALLAEGAARVDPMRIGLDVDEAGALIDRAGVASRRVFAIGPTSRAAFWEITAIPDIRVQAAATAERIAAIETARDAG